MPGRFHWEKGPPISARYGGDSLGICERNIDLEQIAIKFLQTVGYYGPVDMDFRYDHRDGKYKLLDVNPRIGGSFEMFGSENGLDVVRAMYLDGTGQPVMHAQAAEGRKWVVEDIDFMSAGQSYRRGTLRFNEWLESFRGVRHSAFFAWDDPWPALSMLCYDAGKIFARSATGASRVKPFENASEAEPITVAKSVISQGKA